MLFKEKKEYLIKLGVDNKQYRLICTKVTKNIKGEIVSFSFIDPITENSCYEFTLEEVKEFNEIQEPIDNLEFFQMYINWHNFYRKGIQQDLKYAEELRIKILNTLAIRTFVCYGTGALIKYDLNKLSILMNNSEDFELTK